MIPPSPAAPESRSASFWSSRVYVGRSSVGGVACEQAGERAGRARGSEASATGRDVTRVSARAAGAIAERTGTSNG
jgi:hypothetical protein